MLANSYEQYITKSKEDGQRSNLSYDIVAHLNGSSTHAAKFFYRDGAAYQPEFIKNKNSLSKGISHDNYSGGPYVLVSQIFNARLM